MGTRIPLPRPEPAPGNPPISPTASWAPRSPSPPRSQEGHATSSAPAQPQGRGSVLRQRLSRLAHAQDRPLPPGNQTGGPRTPLQTPPVRGAGLGGLGSPRTHPTGLRTPQRPPPAQDRSLGAETRGELPHCFILCFQGPATVSRLHRRSDPALKINNVLTHTANPNEAELPPKGWGACRCRPPTPGCGIGPPSPPCDAPPGAGAATSVPFDCPLLCGGRPGRLP